MSTYTLVLPENIVVSHSHAATGIQKESVTLA